jgi:hypothetical protein
MPHRNILLPDSRWVTVLPVFSARACSRKIPRVAAIHKYLSWVESLNLLPLARAPIHLPQVKFMPISDTYWCSFDAKLNRQDVRIRTRLVQFGAGGLPAGVRRFCFDWQRNDAIF